MGAAEAKLFSREGAKVVIADILEDEGRQTEAEINETGGDAIFIKLDVSQQSDWDAAIERTVEQFGKLDVIVNNAGIASGFYHRRDDSGTLGPDNGRERKGRVPWNEGRHRADAEPGRRRVDNQHIVR